MTIGVWVLGDQLHADQAALALPVPLTWMPSNAFLWSGSAFAAWATGRLSSSG